MYIYIYIYIYIRKREIECEREYPIRERDRTVPILQFSLARRGGSEVDMGPATSDRIYVEAQQHVSVNIIFLYFMHK